MQRSVDWFDVPIFVAPDDWPTIFLRLLEQGPEVSLLLLSTQVACRPIRRLHVRCIHNGPVSYRWQSALMLIASSGKQDQYKWFVLNGDLTSSKQHVYHPG